MSSSTPLAPAVPATTGENVMSSDLMPPPRLPASESANNEKASSNTLRMPSAPTPMSELVILRTHIQTLTELNNRLQTIRHIPAQLLRPPGSDPHKLEATLLTHGFKELGAIAATVRAEKAQDALNAARKSLLADPTNIISNIRRENLKRRRPPSPESPQPYRETESRNTSVLPPLQPGTVPVCLDSLASYIREHNKSGKTKLHIVAPKQGRDLACPIMLRFMAPDVVTVYLTLDISTQSQGLVVVNATTIGSREQKPPHSQSDYMAFQQLSQQLAKVIRSDPFAPLQAFVALLSSYERLFLDACTNCQRVISVEGHVPPVVRKRTASDPKALSWDVRHVVCKYEPPPPRVSTEPGAEAEGVGGGDV